MRVQFTLTNIYRVPCDKPRAPTGHCAAEISTCGPFPQTADILVSYHLKNRSPEEDPSCHSLFLTAPRPRPQCSDWQPYPSQLRLSPRRLTLLAFSWSLCFVCYLCLMTKQSSVNYTDAETQRQAQEQGHTELAMVTVLP